MSLGGEAGFGGVAAEVNLDYLELGADGSGRGYASEAGGQNGCGNLIFAVLDDNVVRVDFPDGNINRAFRFTVDAAGLTLIDENGAATIFTRAVVVPTASQCTATTEVARAVLAAPPGSNSGVVSDGTNLYYNDGLQVVSIAISTLAVGAPITTLGAYDVPIAMQGADFWGHCNCGNNSLTQRTTVAGTMVDSVDTGVDLAHQLTIYAGAFDGAKLFLSGYNYSAQEYELLRINTAGEPDVLEAAVTFRYTGHALVASGGSLWTIGGILGPALISVNGTTGAVTRTVELPGNLYYDSLVVIGQDAYLTAYDPIDDYSSIIIHVTIPS